MRNRPVVLTHTDPDILGCLMEVACGGGHSDSGGDGGGGGGGGVIMMR